ADAPDRHWLARRARHAPSAVRAPGRRDRRAPPRSGGGGPHPPGGGPPDGATANDICQEVFLAVWRNASTFDPARGTVRAWLLQIAHFRTLNELRRQGRPPRGEHGPDGGGARPL